MLKAEVNELLTRTGPGTATGDLFRQYWIPALLAEELRENDAPPVRVKILSERLIAFRNTNGEYGLVDEFCAHRGASLWFGRVEECGIRCAYHGWKYAADGQCLEVPSEPENSNFASKVKLTSYPLVKVGDVLWTYLGDPVFKGAKGNVYNLNDLRPFFEVAEADGGLFVGARRNAEDGKYYWRITPWVMPSFTMVPPRGDHPVHGHFWVPIDDENCWVYTFDYHPTRALTPQEMQAMKDGHGVHSRNIPGTYRPQENKDVDYLMDREAQKRGETFSGVRGIAQQDASLQESMGPIVDRMKERLVPTDTGIIKARQKLRKAVEALRDEGMTPPGVDPAHHRVRSAAIVLRQEESFIEASREALTAELGK